MTFFFSGRDTKVTPSPPGINGTARDGANYYEVKSKDKDIEGCYKKTNFHNLNPKTPDLQYPIYQQTGGHFYLKIDVAEVSEKKGAPWLFSSEEGVKYMKPWVYGTNPPIGPMNWKGKTSQARWEVITINKVSFVNNCKEPEPSSDTDTSVNYEEYDPVSDNLDEIGNKNIWKLL